MRKYCMITHFRDYNSQSDCFKAQNLNEARKEVRIQLSCENVTSVRLFYGANKGEKSVIFYKGVGLQP